MKPWKIAISVAFVVAIAAPAWTAFKREGYLSPLSPSERESISDMVSRSDNCRLPSNTEYGDTICTVLRSELINGGRWIPSEHIAFTYYTKTLD
jgi:hypothetical protein